MIWHDALVLGGQHLSCVCFFGVQLQVYCDSVRPIRIPILSWSIFPYQV